MSRLSLSHLALVVLPLLTVACSEQGFVTTDPKNSGALPAILVTPGQLDFGTVGQSDDAVVQTFTIESVGDADLTVSGIDLLGDSASFTILTDETGVVLPPGTSHDIDVSFVPAGAYDQAAQALVNSDDALNPQALVELLGAGSVPELSIEPDPINFGTGFVGCVSETDVYLSNVGADTLVVDSIGYDGDEYGVFTETSSPSLPLSLEPGESSQILLSFLPLDAVSYSGGLVVHSNDPTEERQAEIQGLGETGGDFTDSWELPSDPSSDIMFLVDQSCSMDDNQSLLATNFSTFISSLSSYTSDWHIIVVNDDDGCNNSGVLTPFSSGYESTFGSAVRSGGFLYTEALLTIAAKGVDQTDSGECNTGFMRDDAMLHVIMVSDEPEQSWDSWSTYVDRIIAKKGSSANVRISAIAGPETGGGSCAEPGTGYMEAVDATGGVYLNICNDWASSSNLADLAEASVFQDTYELSRTPYTDSISVEVNSSYRTTGWSYDATQNAVVFTTRIPTEGDTVDIHYSGNATCD